LSISYNCFGLSDSLTKHRHPHRAPGIDSGFSSGIRKGKSSSQSLTAESATNQDSGPRGGGWWRPEQQ